MFLLLKALIISLSDAALPLKTQRFKNKILFKKTEGLDIIKEKSTLQVNCFYFFV